MPQDQNQKMTVFLLNAMNTTCGGNRSFPHLFNGPARQENPWSIPDSKLMQALQLLCDAFYDGYVDVDISPSSAAFRLVSLP